MSPPAFSRNRPQNRRNLRRGVTAGLLIIALFMLLADKQQSAMISSGRLSIDDPSAKVMGVMAAPVRGIGNVFKNADERSSAFEDNQELKLELERLRPYEGRALELERRISVFENMLAVEGAQNFPKERIIARLVSESNGPFVNSGLINAGSSKGVQQGQAVLAPNGLYGHIVKTGRNSARVLLLTDLSSRISVMSQRSQSRAIMIGDYNSNPKLEFISPEADWTEADRVITSGDDGILPTGIDVGTVVTRKDDLLGVKLFSSDQAVDWVWVLPFDPVKTPEEDPQIEVLDRVSDVPLIDGASQ